MMNLLGHSLNFSIAAYWFYVGFSDCGWGRAVESVSLAGLRGLLISFAALRATYGLTFFWCFFFAPLTAPGRMATSQSARKLYWTVPSKKTEARWRWSGRMRRWACHVQCTGDIVILVSGFLPDASSCFATQSAYSTRMRVVICKQNCG